jgi:transposase
VKRLVARELTVSFVPDSEQRLWRTVTRRKYQLTRDHVRLQNQLESLLEEAHIKLSSLVSNLLGASARRMMKALADGETNPAALAALADKQLRARPEQLCDALGACTDLKPVYRRLLKMALEQLQFLEQPISQLDQEMASQLSQHHDAVERLAIAFLTEETGECGEQELNHSDGQAEKFYRDLKQRGICVRVGMEATGYSRRFERLLAELGFELWIGDPATSQEAEVRS